MKHHRSPNEDAEASLQNTGQAVVLLADPQRGDCREQTRKCVANRLSNKILRREQAQVGDRSGLVQQKQHNNLPVAFADVAEETVAGGVLLDERVRAAPQHRHDNESKRFFQKFISVHGSVSVCLCLRKFN